MTQVAFKATEVREMSWNGAKGIARSKDKNVNISKCPACGVGLGNFVYADAAKA
jgi:hypothetical protein